MTRTLAPAALLTLVACARPERSLGGGEGTSASSGAGSSTGASAGDSGAASAEEGGSDSGSSEASSGATTATTASTGDDGGESGVRLDVDPGAEGEAGTAEGPGGEGCQKVDFLFVIDSSGSMAEEQDNLLASFPGFMRTIRSTLNARDYHLMVVDTDAQDCCGLGGATGNCNGFSCSAYPARPADPCHDTLGAGVIWPRGEQASNQMCGVAAGRRWMTDGDTMIEDAFACAGQVGILGWGGEMQADAAISAASPALNAPGGCNEGFLRDDAILVVTIITDEEDAQIAGGIVAGGSVGGPADWITKLRDVKGGNGDAIVVLGLVGDADLPNPICMGPSDGGGADPAPRLREFFAAFTYNVLGSVCAPDYTPFFEEAVSVIDLSCDSFVPPG